MIEIKVYGQEHCSWCKEAKKYLTEKNIPFQYLTIGEDIDAKTLTEEIAVGARTIPVITVNGHWIGGYTDLRNYVEHDYPQGSNILLG